METPVALAKKVIKKNLERWCDDGWDSRGAGGGSLEPVPHRIVVNFLHRLRDTHAAQKGISSSGSGSQTVGSFASILACKALRVASGKSSKRTQIAYGAGDRAK